MSTICDNKLCAYHCYLPDRKARVASVYVREDGEDVLVHRHLERRVAELENNAKLVNHPTWLIPTSQSIPIRHWTDTTTPIRTDEVTCTGEKK